MQPNNPLTDLNNTFTFTFTFTFMHLADAFIQSDLHFQAIHFFFLSMCVPWELNPQPFALLTQCSTTEPQEHNRSVLVCYVYVRLKRWVFNLDLN